MNIKPILFSGEMIRALLDGRKTQTRRVVKDYHIERLSSRHEFATSGPHQLSLKESPGYAYVELVGGSLVGLPCPHGQPGDMLWCREKWKYWDWTEDGAPWIKYAADDSAKLFDSRAPGEWSDRLENTWANLSVSENYNIDNHARDRKWRPSIFLPRWASRLTLLITDVRVERVQDISEDDCYDEGTLVWANAQDLRHSDGTPAKYPSVQHAFQALWDSINSGRGYGWESNPWVWCVNFEVIKQNVDEYQEKGR